MRGPKRNEGATKIGERAGTKATAKHIRSSAYKARVVLDLIRGLDVVSADQVLQLTDRGIARDIRKVLASAVANATDVNSGAYVADAEELFVIACFADEGATMRRFRPRARGRATRIRKRSCHITIVVARMSESRIEIIQARAEGAGQSAAASRAARVERSRQSAQKAKEAIDSADAVEAAEDAADDADSGTDTATDDVQAFADTDTDTGTTDSDATGSDASGSDADASDTPSDDSGEADDETSADSGTGEFAAGEWAGSVLPDAEGNGPESHPIKGNADSMLYHQPGSRYYKVTKAEVWFDTAEHAEAAGFSEPGSETTSDNDSGDEK